MKATNVLQKKGRMITIDGNEYRIHFTMYALAILTDKYDDMQQVFAAFAPMESGKFGKNEIDILSLLLSAALITHHPDMTQDYIQKSLSFKDVVGVAGELIAEYMVSMGVDTGEAKENADPQTAQ